MASAVIGASLSLASGLWQGHEIRAAGATTENQAVAQVIPQLDNWFKAIIAAYNSGEATPDQALQGLAVMEQQAQEELHRFVGKPGTSWDNVPAQMCGDGAAVICTKTCTVACCVWKAYYSRPIDCAFKAIQSGTTRTVTRGAIAASKYGLPNYPAYTLQIGPAPAQGIGGTVSDTFTSIEQALGVGGGAGQTMIGGGYAAPSGVLQTATSPGGINPLLLLGGGALLLVLLLATSRGSR
jgi:hypothetical protein